MLLTSELPITFHNEEIQSYDQFVEGDLIRFDIDCALLAKTMFNWLDDQVSYKPVRIEKLVANLNILDQHTSLFTALLNILEKGDYLIADNGTICKATFNEEKLNRQVADLDKNGLATLILNRGQWLQTSIGPYIELSRACIPNLPDLLQGKITGIQLLFSAENYERCTDVYGAHLQEVYYGLIAEQIIEKCRRIWTLEPNRQIRILEIGAGSGKGTVRMLEGLRKHGKKIHYCFTDIGNSFLRRAKRTFKEFDCELDFRILDISEDPGSQGFEENTFDIAFATNVLHATPDLKVAISNTFNLLSPGGIILINEIAHDIAGNTVSFGTTPGWWLHTDGLRLPYSPAASTTTYRHLLPEIGFNEVAITGYPGVPENELPQVIIQGIKKTTDHE